MDAPAEARSTCSPQRGPSRPAGGPDDECVPDTPVFTRFRERARALLARGVPPDAASAGWSALEDGAGGTAHLFADADEPLNAAAANPSSRPAPPVRVPAGFLALARSVALHRDAGRFDLLYRLLWRLAHEPALRHDPLDAELLRARRMARAVRRDAYKMRAFVRFRPLREALDTAADTPQAAPTLHVAWFEPEHDVLPAVAPWFARRFAGMRWAILTPQRSVRWRPETQQLVHGPGARRADAPPADPGEALWLTYYRHIFNPARLNLPLMRQHMPRRYWANLPEAAEIGTLAATARQRLQAMIDHAPNPAEPPRATARGTGHASTPPSGALLAPGADPGVPASGCASAMPAAMAATAARHAGAPWPDLATLAAAQQRCRACPLAACATQAVPGEGPLGAALMVVGEQPGDLEDLAGRPFVGPAGQLLDRALQQTGAERGQLFLTNAVRHFKHELRGKRRLHKTPGQREQQACRPWLEAEIALVRPCALLALGVTAAQALLGPGARLNELRGAWHDGPHGLPVYVTWHPAALLRMPPAEREAAWPRWLADWRQALRHAGAADARTQGRVAGGQAAAVTPSAR